jgi:hypothetical protein
MTVGLSIPQPPRHPPRRRPSLSEPVRVPLPASATGGDRAGMSASHLPATAIAAVVLTAALGALGPPPATAQDWQGAGTYKLGTSVQDVNIREYPGAVSMGLIGPGTEVVIVNAPASNGYVFARIRSSTNHTTDPSDDYGINVCAYVPFRLADGTQPFYKTSSETGPYDGTCPGVRQNVDGKQRVPAPRYAQSRASAVTEAGTQSPNDVTDHGQDSYWYSNLAGSNGITAAARCTGHSTTSTAALVSHSRQASKPPRTGPCGSATSRPTARTPWSTSPVRNGASSRPPASPTRDFRRYRRNLRLPIRDR